MCMGMCVAFAFVHASEVCVCSRAWRIRMGRCVVYTYVRGVYVCACA